MKGRYVQQAGKHIQGILRAVLICGMSVQILLGLVWLLGNMGGLQSFQESMALLEGKEFDAGYYSGILYRGLAAALYSHLWILYGIQLAAACGAAYELMACFVAGEKRLLRLFCALALTTVPQALQCHLAVLPWSLGSSLLVGETMLWRKVWQGTLDRQEEKLPEQAKRLLITGMLSGWLLLLLILPVYAWFVLPLLFAALWRTVKKERMVRLACGLAMLMLCLCNVTVSCGWNPADWNRRLAASALSRTGWPYFQDSYEIFPYQLHEDIGLVTSREVSAYADGVERVLIPKLEEQYGAEETTAALWELAGVCLRDNLRTDVKNIIWDMAAYHAAPPILAMQLKGRAYDACSGINYEQMKTRTPLLTGYYVTYGGRWWWMMLALAVAARLCDLLLCGGSRRGNCPWRGKNGIWSRWRMFLQYWLPVLVGMEWMILRQVFSGSGIMDYKKVLWVTMLWYVMALCGPGDGTEERGRKWQL
ncbi:MAG: hypothetical protein K2K19_11265 [Acetatifactor sp.]|nr:hypothetical protein [Acetatifactor sp.]